MSFDLSKSLYICMKGKLLIHHGEQKIRHKYHFLTISPYKLYMLRPYESDASLAICFQGIIKSWYYQIYIEVWCLPSNLTIYKPWPPIIYNGVV